MATETTNYKLKKPEYNEYVDIGVLNENFDVLDEKVADVEDKLNNLDIPTPDVSGQIEIHNDAEDAHSETLAKKNHTHVPSEVGISYGTTDLTAGTSALETGKLYLVYE